MKRLLGALSFVGATLFAVNGANAALLGSFNLSPTVTGFGSVGSGPKTIPTGLPVWWQINISSFSNPVDLYVSFSTQSASFQTSPVDFGVRLCSDPSSLANCTGSTIGSILNTLSNASYSDFDLLATGLVNGGAYYLYFNGTPSSASGDWTFSFNGAVTPIPTAALLFASGLGFLGFAGRKRKGQAAAASDEAPNTPA